MNEKEKEMKGRFEYEQDSKHYHRFRVEADSRVVGSLYVPKDVALPDKIFSRSSPLEKWVK